MKAVIKMNMTYIWLGLVIVFAVFEAATAGLTSIWFAAGALFAMIAAVLGAGIWMQIIVFIAVSAVLLVFVRQIAYKFITPKIEATNADALIGKIGIVTEKIDNDVGCGEVKVDGKAWSARSFDNNIVEVNAKVEIVKIEGVKLIIKNMEE